jgi:hypothetical protein
MPLGMRVWHPFNNDPCYAFDSDVRMKAFQATEVFLKTHHLKVVANFLLNKIAVLEIVCLVVVVTFESCRCGACWCITGKLCQSPY